LKVPSDNQRTIAIARIIDRYVTEHPNAADTPEGIRSWWIARHLPRTSLEDVQKALDHLVVRGRLIRVTLADGTTVYARGTSRPDGQALQQLGSSDPVRSRWDPSAILGMWRGNHGS
jgi:hypothetical protein